MSVAGKIKSDLSNLVAILDSYNHKIKDWENHLSLDKKNIESANVEHATWYAYYDQLAVETNGLMHYMEMRYKKARGEAMMKIQKHAKEAHGVQALERLIDADPVYVEEYIFFLEIRDLHLRIKSIADRFKDRGFSLKNINAIRLAQLEKLTIHINEYE